MADMAEEDGCALTAAARGSMACGAIGDRPVSAAIDHAAARPRHHAGQSGLER